ncbi:LysM peptidoglycan-binding domain-containing protein [Rummeliibacillus stabekisii]|uniref:cell division suppressor protein YneA n=1 Tax=Rummeliibacillus stabekisii TaxID=241244 RepID=UPI00203C3C50|nr:LysM peptidoglycan-binding domain-containing protein [Rummeliibacillus stabekisii]MCM3315909.1 LysM peptidoglycan-binding domain-containing protein [Rummeliibacillus stabekisii]
MNWIKKNRNTTYLFAFIFAIMVILMVINRDTTSYTNIEVQEGDTLWSLSGLYKGDLSKSEWVSLVKDKNNIIDGRIIAGHTLSIPAYKKINTNKKGIELASENE